MSSPARAEHKWTSAAEVRALVINGGSDSPNSGVTCFTVAASVSSVCPSGYLAVPKNNKDLLAVLLSAKATKARIRINYSDSENARDSGHCSGLAFTPCVVNSIELR